MGTVNSYSSGKSLENLTIVLFAAAEYPKDLTAYISMRFLRLGEHE
jgi:hypothetical protein